MNMKKIIPVMMLAAVPVMGMGQNKPGLFAKNLDKGVRPQDNFYKYANGGWQKDHPLPAAYGRFGSFDLLQEDNNKRINTILDELRKKSYKAGTLEQKLSDFYKLALDVDRRNKEGIAPVKPLLDSIEAANCMCKLRRIQLASAPFDYGVPFGFGFGADEKNVTMNIMNVMQGGLTLGQRDYYINNDSATVAIRNAFKKHIVRMFKLYGFTDEQARAKAGYIFRLETELALISKSNVELRDPQANYNKMTLAEFKEKYPNINFEQLANAEGVDSKYIQDLVVGQPKFFEGLNAIYGVMTPEELKAKMEWSVILSSASYLTDEIREARFDFFGRTMSGRKEDYPLWRRATSQVEAQMGEALGRMYCKRYFPESSKKIMEQLIENLRVSLGQRIDAQDWMSPETKANAHKKLDKFYVKVGYPNKWRSYDKLSIDPSKSFFENVQACVKYANDDAIERQAGKPVDRDQWYMTPQTVNAYYNPTTNEICFPAGILQYPFFDPKADEAFNYGAIGVVIGHEMTHGFDDQGRQYDADGNLNDWWTPQDAKGFEERAKLYANFFDSIEVLPGLHANGEYTLGENLADHGGLKVAFNAYKNATAGKTLKDWQGITADQRFFLAYAGVWADNITEKEIRNRTKSDPHSLGRWRVNGALPHIAEWYQAFGVTPKDKMFIPESKRLQLW